MKKYEPPPRDPDAPNGAWSRVMKRGHRDTERIIVDDLEPVRELTDAEKEHLRWWFENRIPEIVKDRPAAGYHHARVAASDLVPAQVRARSASVLQSPWMGAARVQVPEVREDVAASGTLRVTDDGRWRVEAAQYGYPLMYEGMSWALKFSILEVLLVAAGVGYDDPRLVR